MGESPKVKGSPMVQRIKCLIAQLQPAQMTLVIAVQFVSIIAALALVWYFTRLNRARGN